MLTKVDTDFHRYPVDGVWIHHTSLADVRLHCGCWASPQAEVDALAFVADVLRGLSAAIKPFVIAERGFLDRSDRLEFRLLEQYAKAAGEATGLPVLGMWALPDQRRGFWAMECPASALRPISEQAWGSTVFFAEDFDRRLISDALASEKFLSLALAEAGYISVDFDQDRDLLITRLISKDAASLAAPFYPFVGEEIGR